MYMGVDESTFETLTMEKMRFPLFHEWTKSNNINNSSNNNNNNNNNKKRRRKPTTKNGRWTHPGGGDSGTPRLTPVGQKQSSGLWALCSLVFSLTTKILIGVVFSPPPELETVL
jgi:hypothetical protein